MTGTRKECPLLPVLFNLMGYPSMHWTREITSKMIKEGMIKLCLFTDDINARISTGKLQSENSLR